jgi:mono/diheme cytochrome c family protein
MPAISFMRSFLPPVALAGIMAAAGPAAAQLPPDLAAQLPPPATAPVDFVRDIQPIFEASCVQCHGRGKAKGSFSLETRQDFLLGGDSGPPAIAGNSAASAVVEMISGLNPDVIMPQKGRRLTGDEIAVFRAWIDQGMPWPEHITFFKTPPANLLPRDLAELAPDPRFANPIDGFVDAHVQRHGIAWGEPVDDRTYARRAWLDTIGLLPPVDELEAFVADTAPDKRAQLVRRLLSDRQRYAEHWLTFWNDLLRNDYKGPGYTDGGRKPITSWLYAALAGNLPYDRFVAQLVNPGAESDGFASGILWRGAVNASMVPPMQAAQGIAQVFLGVNLKCASCHDSFINEYTLADAYGLAAVYADGPLEVAECDKPTGHNAKVKFLYEEVGSIDGRAGPGRRREQLMEIITGRQNGRLPRTIVNRLWERFMGRGLVEPVDEMDKPAWSPELLDWLAEDLVAHGYNLKHTMERILTSRAYQLRAVGLDETEETHVFRGPAVRRLSAEQFSDALYAVAGLAHARADARLNRHAALNPRSGELLLQPKWIWSTADAAVKTKPVTLIFRRVVTLPAAPAEAHFAISADDNYDIRINGRSAGRSPRRNMTITDWVDVKPHLKAGDNTIEITAANMPPDEGRLVSVKTGELPDADSPAGLILYARIRAATGEVMDFVSDRTWAVLAYPRPPATSNVGVTEPGRPRDVGPAIELGGVDLAPWKLGRHFLDVAAAPRDTLPVHRSSLVAADPLMTALGRPNREQIITVRQATATTLQALELTNGVTLAAVLKRAAADLLAANPAAAATTLIDTVYQQMITRQPTAAEQAVAHRLVGNQVTSEGLEDLLWSLAMLPEFQLIH